MQFSGLWSLLDLQSLSRMFQANLVWGHDAEVLNWTFFSGALFSLFLIGQKKLLESFQLFLMVLFFADVFSERKILAFSVTWIILNSVNKKKESFRQSRKKNDEKFKDFSVVQFTRIEVLN